VSLKYFTGSCSSEGSELSKILKHKHSILVVDDEDAILNAFNRILADEDYEVHTASNGLEALNKLKTAQKPYSIIISDQRMPQMNGVQFLPRPKIFSGCRPYTFDRLRRYRHCD